MVVLAAAGIVIWWFFFPSPERAIKKRLTRLSEVISADVSNSNIKRVANVNQLASFFSADVAIDASSVSRYNELITGRDELTQAIMAARTMVQKIEAKFYNIEIEVDESRKNATVELTALVKLNNQEDPFLGDVKLTMRKEDRQWMISSVAPARPQMQLP
jgi:hypothetical protein